jgi:lipopolysaccharide/colanic/teichoic acid biosynthesis glycosyltransferase
MDLAGAYYDSADEIEPTHPQAKAYDTELLEQLFVQPMPIWKRTVDLLGASLGIVLLAPLFVLVAAAIKLTSRGPILFTQPRSGRGGLPFKMYKFRSMVVNAEAMRQALLENNEQDGPAFKMERDPRITTIGRFIRKTSIDELPQLLNVIRGEMSLVGPRPLLCSETDACENWQRRRLDVVPGLTCIWQVQDGRTNIPFADWARMDIRYIGSRTLKHDFQLVLKTIRSIVGGKGA